MNHPNPWLRLAAGILAVAIAIRVAVSLVMPVLAFVLGATVLVALVIVIRRWHANRW